jgi:RND family efflux transporter MFP subunit
MRYSKVVVLLAAMLPVMFAGTTQAADSLPSVVVEYHTLPRVMQLDGVVEAVHQGTVSAQTQGEVIEVLFDVDDKVEAGAVIARLKDTRQKAALEQAEAAVAAARARLDEARDEYQRVKEVFGKKLVAQADMDRAESALKSAKADFDSAQSAVVSAREQLNYTVVRAPYSGLVIERHIEVGETASPGVPIMTGISQDDLRVAVDVPQRLISHVREYRQARIETDGDQRIDATGLTFFPYADPRGNTFRVRVDLPSGAADLLPGMFVKVAFTIGDEDLMLIPQRAVVYRSEVTGVYVLDEDGDVRLRRIRAGHKLDDGMIAVRAGLQEGEQVVTDPIRAGVVLKQGGKDGGES